MNHEAAEIISTSDVPLWRYPEFHRMCLEAATHFQKRVGSIMVQFCYEKNASELLQEPHLRMFLYAVIAWRGSAFAEVHSPLDWRTGSSILVRRLLRKSAKYNNCITSKQLIESLGNALKDLENEFDKLKKRKKPKNYRPLC